MRRFTGRAVAASGVDSPLAGHEVDAGPHVERPQLLLEPAHVACDLRPDEGVEADRREALVLAILGQDLGRDREKGLRELLAHDLGDPRLVRRV
jgi:hypothetical protein